MAAEGVSRESMLSGKSEELMKLGPFTKRTVLCFTLGLGMTALIINLFLPHGNSKWASFQKIKQGMTKAEVESIMGKTEIYFPTISIAGQYKLGWFVEATSFSDQYCLEAKFDQKWTLIETRSYPVNRSHFHRFFELLGW